MRYVSKGMYVIDMTTGIAALKTIPWKDGNVINDADNERLACAMADVVAAALNDYDAKQGGL